MFKIIKKTLKEKFTKKEVASSELTPYIAMGGEQAINELVDRFYHHMDTNPNAKRCRDLHHESLNGAAMKLKMFLSGWLGGPSLYIEKYGHPRMRKRHFPFKIGEREKNEWLLCMREALNDMNFESQLDHQLWQGFRRFADHMKNSDD